MHIRELTRRRFWEKVEKSDGCWVWKGSVFQWRGYGEVRFQGKRIGAHRLSYILTHGSIPDGKHILHSCDNPICVNPLHLRAGTHQENMDDKNRKGRGNYVSGKDHPFSRNPAIAPRGEAKHKSNLKEHDIREIRKRRLQGETQAAIAADYGVHQSTISHIITNTTWAHV